ncbi:MAG: hypothetical protein KIT87_22830, partial [Anaerolineae bacterium]|nr:hypothetical protein [Anaerolineae bacterium]
MHAWLASALRRFYPTAPAETQPSLTLDIARGERVAFQVVVRTEERDEQITAQVAAPEGVTVQTRRVGYVPLRHLNTQTPLNDVEGVGHIPGLVPDPLLPEATLHAGPHETNAFWITLHTSADRPPGE